MADDFLDTTLGATGWPVYRLGLSASYRPGRKAILAAMDRGVNYFFGYGFDSQMFETLRDVFKTRRAELIVATGGYNCVLWRSNLRRSLERRLKQLGTDYLDVVPRGSEGVFSVGRDGRPKPGYPYWKGFKPRTATGLGLEHLRPEK